MVAEADDLLARLSENWQQLAPGLIGIGSTILGGLFTASAVLLVVYYMASAGPRLRAAICRMLAPARQREVLRLWEWERTRDLVLQIDLSLATGSDRMYASTRVINPDPEEKPLYYWTNIAVPESPRTRVLTTADSAWRTEYSGALTSAGSSPR